MKVPPFLATTTLNSQQLMVTTPSVALTKRGVFIYKWQTGRGSKGGNNTYLPLVQ